MTFLLFSKKSVSACRKSNEHIDAGPSVEINKYGSPGAEKMPVALPPPTLTTNCAGILRSPTTAVSPQEKGFRIFDRYKVVGGPWIVIVPDAGEAGRMAFVPSVVVSWAVVAVSHLKWKVPSPSSLPVVTPLRYTFCPSRPLNQLL